MMGAHFWPNMYQSTAAKVLTKTNSIKASARTSIGMASREYFIPTLSNAGKTGA